MIIIGILIGIVLMAVLTPIVLIVDAETERTPKLERTKGMKTYVWIRDFIIN